MPQQFFLNPLYAILQTLTLAGRDDHTNALRHRLTHGEYFDSKDTEGRDYRSLLHSRMMEYFNESILKEPLRNSTIVNAPRHPFGNSDQSISYLRARDTAKLCLVNVLADAEPHGIDNLVPYEHVWDNDLREARIRIDVELVFGGLKAFR